MAASVFPEPAEPGAASAARECDDRCTRTRLTRAALDLIWSCSYGATSVEAICEKAGARKGSFYHFFASKSALAVEALEAHWVRRQPEMNAAFCPSIAPLERLRGYFETSITRQATYKKSHGVVLGCPLFSIGCEICTQDRAIGDKVHELMGRNLAYFEAAIAEAHASGAIEAPDAAARAKMLFAYYEGVLTQARIQNSLEPLAALMQGVADLLGGTAEEWVRRVV